MEQITIKYDFYKKPLSIGCIICSIPVMLWHIVDYLSSDIDMFSRSIWQSIYLCSLGLYSALLMYFFIKMFRSNVTMRERYLMVLTLFMILTFSSSVGG